MNIPNSPLHCISHPLVQHKLTLLRDRRTDSAAFRRLLEEAGALMAYEVTRDVPLQPLRVDTPLEAMLGVALEAGRLVFVSILRAGNGLLDGLLRVAPEARVGFIGLQRDEQTLRPTHYYAKMPPNMAGCDVIVCDPMLATGHSAVAALDLLAAEQPRTLAFLCLLAAPEGIATVQAAHPGVPIYTAAIDRQLNAQGYILPGLGDAGDRLYGTVQ